MSDKRNLKLLFILKRYSAGTGESERRVFFKNKYSEKPSSFNKKFSVSVSKNVLCIYSLDERVPVK